MNAPVAGTDNTDGLLLTGAVGLWGGRHGAGEEDRRRRRQAGRAGDDEGRPKDRESEQGANGKRRSEYRCERARAASRAGVSGGRGHEPGSLGWGNSRSVDCRRPAETNGEPRASRAGNCQWPEPTFACAKGGSGLIPKRSATSLAEVGRHSHRARGVRPPTSSSSPPPTPSAALLRRHPLAVGVAQAAQVVVLA